MLAWGFERVILRSSSKSSRFAREGRMAKRLHPAEGRSSLTSGRMLGVLRLLKRLPSRGTREP